MKTETNTTQATIAIRSAQSILNRLSINAYVSDEDRFKASESSRALCATHDLLNEYSALVAVAEVLSQINVWLISPALDKATLDTFKSRAGQALATLNAIRKGQ